MVQHVVRRQHTWAAAGDQEATCCSVEISTMIREANDGWCMGVKGVGGWAAAEPRSAFRDLALIGTRR